jgi:hypothetical protein
MININQYPTFIKSFLGRFALWVEATLGLYNNPDILKDQMPKTEEEWLIELAVMYNLFKKVKKENNSGGKYYKLFNNRALLDIWAACCSRQDIPKTMEEAIILVKDAQNLSMLRFEVNQYFGEIAYYKNYSTDLEIYTSSIESSEPLELFQLYLLLDFIVTQNMIQRG